jgi:hypothetical protein
MGSDEVILRQRLGEAFSRLQDPTSPGFTAQEREFVFHMLDWRNDLEQLALLYSSPGRFSTDQAHEIIQAFLYHASSHIVAAARLAERFLDSFATVPPNRDGE